MEPLQIGGGFHQKALCLRVLTVIFSGMFSSENKSVHFVGIGGTAMASAAVAIGKRFCRHWVEPVMSSFDKRFDQGPSWMR
jgi:hypothetical protein